MGHIFFISDAQDIQLTELSNWTLDWMLSHDVPADTAIYTCNGIAQGEEALKTPLAQGESPALIVLDHGTHPSKESIAFSKRLRDAIPESWTIDLVPGDYPVPEKNEDAFLMQKPIRKGDWTDVLNHVFIEAGSPQWSNASSFHP